MEVDLGVGNNVNVGVESGAIVPTTWLKSSVPVLVALDWTRGCSVQAEKYNIRNKGKVSLVDIINPI